MTDAEVDQVIVARLVERVKERGHLGFKMALPLWPQLYALIAPDGLVLPHALLTGLAWGLALAHKGHVAPNPDAARGYAIGRAVAEQLGVKHVSYHASMKLWRDYDDAVARDDHETADRLRPFHGKDIT